MLIHIVLFFLLCLAGWLPPASVRFTPCGVFCWCVLMKGKKKWGSRPTVFFGLSVFHVGSYEVIYVPPFIWLAVQPFY